MQKVRYAAYFLVLVTAVFVLGGCNSSETAKSKTETSSAPAASTASASKDTGANSLQEIMKARNLTEKIF